MNATELMHGLTANQLRFTIRAVDTITFGPQPGTALRGALYNTLLHLFCEPNEPELLASTHPVHWLMAREDLTSKRGENIPRPLTMEPPLHRNRFNPGDKLTFGCTLIGQARNMLPYIVRAISEMGKEGVGKKGKNKKRGSFALEVISERCPLLDTQRRLMKNNFVEAPRLAVTPARVADAVAMLPQDRMSLRFRTPTRLIVNGHLVKQFDMVTFIKRVVERCQSLVTYYAETEPPPREVWRDLHELLSEKAKAVQVIYENMHWIEVSSGSRRQQREVPISGFIGDVTVIGDLRPLQPWILWGSVLHVGKNAVKGNGWYDVIA